MLQAVQSTSMLPCRCLRTPRLSRCFTPSSRLSAGSFKVDGSLHTFHERKILPYTQRQLYAMVADVENYSNFLPFILSSTVGKHSGRGSVADKPWLDDEGSPGDVHTFDAVLKIGALGFEESWKSHVTCEKYREVSAYADPSSLFKVLRSTWTLTPTPRDAPHMSKASPPRDGNPLAVPGRPFSTSTLLADAQSVPSDQQNPTMVSIDLAYEFANPLYRIAAGQTFQDVSRKIMGAFEKRVQIKYGDGVL